MMRRCLLSATVACGLVVLCAASVQAREFPVVGAPGAQGARLMCPPGTGIIGFHGRIGQWTDQIGLICGVILGPPYQAGTGIRVAAVGGGGGAAFEDECTGPTIVSSITIGIVTDSLNGRARYLWGIAFSCRGLIGSDSTAHGKFEPRAVLSADFLVPVSQAPQSCSAPHTHAIGLNVRFGQHVNGAGLICGPVVAMSYPTADARGNVAPPQVYGEIGRKYAALGREGGALGRPRSIEFHASYGGRCQSFEQGTICWHPEMGEAYAVWGAIGEKWRQSGEVEFGYPMTDEGVCADGRGRYNHFRSMQHPGRPEASIFWSPQTGAHAVYGAIRDAWASQGWERGPLGYPTSDEHQDGKHRRVNFERGFIRWAPNTGIEIMR